MGGKWIFGLAWFLGLGLGAPNQSLGNGHDPGVALVSYHHQNLALGPLWEQVNAQLDLPHPPAEHVFFIQEAPDSEEGVCLYESLNQTPAPAQFPLRYTGANHSDFIRLVWHNHKESLELLNPGGLPLSNAGFHQRLNRQALWVSAQGATAGALCGATLCVMVPGGLFVHTVGLLTAAFLAKTTLGSYQVHRALRQAQGHLHQRANEPLLVDLGPTLYTPILSGAHLALRGLFVEASQKAGFVENGAPCPPKPHFSPRPPRVKTPFRFNEEEAPSAEMERVPIPIPVRDPQGPRRGPNP